MASPLVDDAPKDIKYILTAIETDPWLKLGLQKLEPHAGGTPTRFKKREFDELVAWIEIEAQPEWQPVIDNYYAYPATPTNLIDLVQDNDATVSGTVVTGGGIVIGGTVVTGGGIVIGGTVVTGGGIVISGTVVAGGGIVIGGTVVAGSGIVIGGTVMADRNAVFSGGLTIREQMPTAPFHISPAVGEPRDITWEEQRSWDRCEQVLFAFISYAKEILKLKKIAVTETRIRNWQAIEDTNWKQCILDITVKAESSIALRVWDELTEELQQFINTQPDVIRPFLKDKLSLDVKWI